jgi:hypothetical protein
MGSKVNRGLTLGANLGVLVGIFLLVVELDQNREMIRAQTRNDISQQMVNRLSMMGSDIKLASLWRRAQLGEVLSLDEETQYFLLFVANMRDWENIHYQYRHGMFDESEFNAERSTWKSLVNKNKAFPRVWCVMRTNFSPLFIAELEGLLDEDVCATFRHE